MTFLSKILSYVISTWFFEIHDSRNFKVERFSFNSRFYFKHIRVVCSKLVQNHTRNEMNKAPNVPNVVTSSRCDVETSRCCETPLPPSSHDMAGPYVAKSPHRDIETSSLSDVEMSQRWNVMTLGVFDSNVMSSHFTSHHVMSRYVTSRHFGFR